jgi:hypothetical protein
MAAKKRKYLMFRLRQSINNCQKQVTFSFLTLRITMLIKKKNSLAGFSQFENVSPEFHIINT